jgi:hypothetical protein
MVNLYHTKILINSIEFFLERLKNMFISKWGRGDRGFAGVRGFLKGKVQITPFKYRESMKIS